MEPEGSCVHALFGGASERAPAGQRASLMSGGGEGAVEAAAAEGGGAAASAPRGGSVRLKGIRKRYGALEILRGFDLEIGPGELVVLLGRSGCGKSTLLRAIAGLEEIDGGEIWIGDRRVDREEPRDRGVSMVFQSYALFPHMTVEENLGFALTVRGADPATRRAKVLEAAKLLGIEDLLDRFPRALSGGQRQRVAIGRSIVRAPEIYLFDEPLSNLDAALRSRMRVELRALHERLGATMVYVTHDQVEAMTLADRIAVVEAGRVEQVGPPDEIYRRPRNVFVATFVGTPAMNTIEIAGGTAGIRPEEVSIRPKTDRPYPVNDGVSITQLKEDLRQGVRGVVEAVEPVGDRGYLHIRSGRVLLVASIEGARAFEQKPGREVCISVAPSAVHFFDVDGTRVPDDEIATFAGRR
jgi:ABC-type sugar transport system ATPase subunit